MRLHVAVFGAEELLGTVPGEVFDHVDELAPPVIPPAGIPFGVFVRQNAAHALHDGGTGVVLAGDHLQAVALAVDFVGDGCQTCSIPGKACIARTVDVCGNCYAGRIYRRCDL